MIRVQSLGHRLVFWFVVLGIVPAAAMASGAFFWLRADREEQALRHLQTVARAQAAVVEAGLPAPAAELAARLQEGGPETVVLLDADGRVVAGEAPSGRILQAEAQAGSYRVRVVRSRDDVDAPLNGLALMLLVAGGVAFVLVLFALRRVGGRVEEHLESMVESLEQAARGDFGVEMAARDMSVCAPVSVAINDMHARLKEREEQINAQRHELFCQRCELARLNVEIVQADRMKSEFVANMSHEVRTPLHSVLSLSELLLKETSGTLNEEQQRQVRIIERNGRALLEMLGDILDFSKIEARLMSVDIGDVAPGSVLAGVRETVAPLARDKGLELVLRSPVDLPQLRSDADKIYRAILNLAHNAVKFTERGTVTLAARARGDGGVELSVSDTGPGIAPEDIGTVFEPFRQLDGSTTRANAGTGLGLTISKSLVELLGGRIAVESEPGRGTTFTVSFLSEAQPRFASGARPQPDENQILVLGATPQSGDAVRQELRAAGFTAGQAVCGRDVETALLRPGVGVILLDLGLVIDDGGIAILGPHLEGLARGEQSVLGYWLDPAQLRGGFLGRVGVEANMEANERDGGGYSLTCGNAPPLRLDAARDDARAWYGALQDGAGVPMREVMRRIVLGLDRTLHLEVEA